MMGLITAGAAVDTIPPKLVSAAINAAGTLLSLTFDKALDPVSVPTLALGGAALSAVTGAVSVSGAVVSQSVTPAVCVDESGLTVTTSGNVIQDKFGNNAAALTGQAVTNGSTHVFAWNDLPGLLFWADTMNPACLTLTGGGTPATALINLISSQSYDTPVNDIPYEAAGLDGNPVLHPTGVTGDRMQATEAAVYNTFVNTPTGTFCEYGSFDAADPSALGYTFSVSASGSNNGSHSFGTSSTSTGRYIYRTVEDSGTAVATESATTIPATTGHFHAWLLNNGSISHTKSGAAADPSGATNAPATITPARVGISCKCDSTPDSPRAYRWGEKGWWNRVLSAAELARLADRTPVKWA
jgi:hypothetical protein